MYVWTILKDKQEYDTLMQDGILYCDHSNNNVMVHEWPELKNCYDWIAQKLRVKTNRYWWYTLKYGIKNLVYPRWVWYKIEGNTNPMEINKCFYSGMPGDYKLLIFDIDSKYILLSDYDRWHLCMMRCHLENSEEETNAWDKYVETCDIDYLKIFDDDYYNTLSVFKKNRVDYLRKSIIKSWDEVLDIDKENDYSCMKNSEKTIQGVTWFFRKKDLCFATDFHISRKELDKYNEHLNSVDFPEYW